MVSYRLGGTDGVSIEAAKWQWALGTLGYEVRTVAGQGAVDHLLPGLAIDATEPPQRADIEAALAGADLVVVENLCSLPMNPAASTVVARALKGRAAILHHHDLPWQRPHFARFPPPSDDPAWLHVTINDLSRRQLEDRGIKSVVLRNAFDCSVPSGSAGGNAGLGIAKTAEQEAIRQRARRKLGIADDAALVLQPTRAIPRKNVAGGLALAEALGATYWLLGSAEDGYGAELERIFAGARTAVIHGAGTGSGFTDTTLDISEAYAASDVVVLPSTWEGFGNPAIESAVHRRPLAIGPYPVASELAAFGFRWFAHDDYASLRDWLKNPDSSLLDHNEEVARAHFALRDLPSRLKNVLRSSLWDYDPPL